MNKSMLAGGILGAVAVTALGSIAGYNYLEQKPQYAEVVSSQAITEDYSVPVQQCKDVIVQQKQAVKDDNQIAGTVLGAVVGGVLGNQVGGGKGKKLATVAGVAAGGYAGKQVQQDMQNKDTVQSTKQVCQTVQQTKQKIVGYQVRYLLNGELKSVQMAEQPGKTLLVTNGQVVADTAQSGAKSS